MKKHCSLLARSVTRFIVARLEFRRLLAQVSPRALLRSCAVIALIVAGAACSTMEKPKKPKRFPSQSQKEQPREKLVERMPWEIWQPFQDLRGGQLVNRSLILGDEFHEQGRRPAALDAYKNAASEGLNEVEAEAAALRIASEQLALDQAKNCLMTVGAHFKKQGKGEENVDVPFALLLAFAYGRHGDIEQSLAWFSKVATQGRPGGPAVQTAASGTGMLLRTLSQDEFEKVAVNWHEDTFITEQVGKERFRRSSQGPSSYEEYDPKVPFWIAFGGVSLAEQSVGSVGGGVGGPASIGLIVSLSDRFGALGRDTKQGFELAVEANNASRAQKISVLTRDVGADSAQSSAAVRELATGTGVSVIAGPLLTEPAVSAAQTARDLNVPIVSLSKSDAFETGGGVFRLGATTSSQVDAIVNAAFNDYGISRFAIAHPQSAVGTEYLEAFRKKVGALGLSLELEVSYSSSDDNSLMDVAQQLEGSSAEAVLIADGIEVSEKILRNFSSALRKRMRPLGTAMWDNAVKIARSQALFERAVFVTPFFSQSTRPEAQGFVESYKAKYKVMPNFLAAQGFDAGTLIMNALARRDNGAISFDEALRQTPQYNGVTGVISVRPSGEIVRSFYVVEVMRDTFQEKLPASKAQTGLMSSSSSVMERNNGLNSSKTSSPVLGDYEKVDSGY
jgi:branched-chain amino acid transport system substrate-binding protein